MRRSILVSLSAATVAAVFLAAVASVDAQRVGPRGGSARMADRLDLTTEQRDAIAVINQESRDVIAPLVGELRLAESNQQRAKMRTVPGRGPVAGGPADVRLTSVDTRRARISGRNPCARMTEAGEGCDD